MILLLFLSESWGGFLAINQFRITNGALLKFAERSGANLGAGRSPEPVTRCYAKHVASSKECVRNNLLVIIPEPFSSITVPIVRRFNIYPILIESNDGYDNSTIGDLLNIYNFPFNNVDISPYQSKNDEPFRIFL